MRYQFRLICSQALELYRTEFSHPLLAETLRCSRGKNDDLFNEAGSFQYSRAVRALLLLVTEQLLNGIDKCVSLSGDRGSFASSLDQAVAREPQWLLEMFGQDEQKESICRRLFLRTNPNHKKPGPVTIGFKPAMLRELGLEISINGLVPATKVDLLALQESLLKESSTGSIAKTPLESIYPLLDDWLLGSLRNFQVFSATGAIARLKAINADSEYSHYSTKTLRLAQLETTPSYDWVHGLLSPQEIAELRSMPRLRIATPLSVLGSQLIIQHTAATLGLPLSCDPTFPHAAGLADDIVSNRFPDLYDGMALAAPPTARVVGQCAFEPITYMPDVTHHLITANGGVNASEYLIFTYGGPTTPLFLFNHLQAQNKLPRSGILMTPAEPHEILQRFAIAPEECRSLLFAPYSLIIASKLNLALTPATSGSPTESTCFLFLRSGKLSHRLTYLLVKALRHSWLELLERPELRRNVVRQTFTEDRVVRTFERACGLAFL